MTGAPGIGKSSFVKKIEYDWACNVFRQFALIFSVTLRLLDIDESIEDAIIAQTPPLIDKDVSPAMVKKILEKYGHEILLLLDGYDEVREDVRNSPNNPIAKVIRRERYGKVNVLVTSRPQVTNFISQYFPSEASILGFSRERAKKFVAYFFPDEPELQDLIIQFAERNGERDMWKIPILLLFTCLLVQSEEIDVEKTTIVPLNTMYERLINCLFKRYCSKEQKIMSEEDIIKAVLSFGKIALSCLKDDSLLFNKSEITEELGDHAFHYGIIVGEPDRRNISQLSSGDTRVMFVHRSLQEYLAARFVADQVVKSGLTLESVVPDIVMKNLMGKYMLFTSFLNEMLQISSLPENQGGASANNIHEHGSESERQFASKERKILCEKATESFAKRRWVNLVGYSITPASADFVTQALSRNEILVNLELEDLDLSHCLSPLFSGHMQSLESLAFTSCVFKEDDSVAQTFSGGNSMPWLREVILTSCKIYSLSATVMLRKILSKSRRLQVVTLQSCNLRHKLCCIFDECFSNLEILKIHDCKLQESLENIAKARPIVPKFRNLNIQDCSLGPGAYAYVAKFTASSKNNVFFSFKKADGKKLDAQLLCQFYPNVYYMHVHGNGPDPYDKDGNMAYTGVGSFPSLKRMVFRDIFLCSDVIKCLSQSLERNLTCFGLSFSGCAIEGLSYLGMRCLPGLENVSIDDKSAMSGDDPSCSAMNTFPNVTGLSFMHSYIKPPFNLEVYSNVARFLAKSTRLIHLVIPVTKKALEVLLENDLPVVHTMFLTLVNEEEIHVPRVSFTPRKRFENLKCFCIGGDRTDDGKDPLHVPKQLFAALSGHSKLRSCTFYSLHLSRGCLAILLEQCLPALEYLLFANCVLHESHELDMKPFAGNLPKVMQFGHFHQSIWNTHALKLLLTCLSGSKVLEQLNLCGYVYDDLDQWYEGSDSFVRGVPFYKREQYIAEHARLLQEEGMDKAEAMSMLNEMFEEEDQVNEIHKARIFEDKISNVISNPVIDAESREYALSISAPIEKPADHVKTRYLDVSNAISGLLGKPLEKLTHLVLNHCVYNEENADLSEICSHAFPMLRLLILDSTNRISNSAIRCICKAISGCKHLGKLSVKNTDMTDCIDHLLIHGLPSLLDLDLEGCILHENGNVLAKIKAGSLGSLNRLDLTKCRVVNAHAIQILCKAVGSSPLHKQAAATPKEHAFTYEHFKKYLDSNKFNVWKEIERVGEIIANHSYLSNVDQELPIFSRQQFWSHCEPNSGLSLFKLFGTNMDNCLAFLLASSLHSLTLFDIAGCSLTDPPCKQNVAGFLPRIAEIDLTSCETVSPHSVSILLSAVSGGDALKTFMVKNVDLSIVCSELLTPKFPSLTKLLMEGCTLSSIQLVKFVGAKSKGHFPALIFLQMNQTQGIIEFCCTESISTPESPGQEESNQSIDNQDIVSLCSGLWCIEIKGCGLTKGIIDKLAHAVDAGKIRSLRQLKIEQNILTDFSREAFQKNGLAIF